MGRWLRCSILAIKWWRWAWKWQNSTTNLIESKLRRWIRIAGITSKRKFELQSNYEWQLKFAGLRIKWTSWESWLSFDANCQ
jgi:hypothetical protein